MKQSLAVLFPGTGYTCGEPLMQKIARQFLEAGYQVVQLDFSAVPFHELAGLEEAAERVKPLVLEQLKGIEPAACGEIVFVSKSLGTVCAGWLEKEWGVPARQLYLTPLPQTLDCIRETSRVAGMVIGTQDRFMTAEALQAFCTGRGIPCLVAAGTGHNLKYADPAAAEELERKILALCSVPPGAGSRE